MVETDDGEPNIAKTTMEALLAEAHSHSSTEEMKRQPPRATITARPTATVIALSRTHQLRHTATTAGCMSSLQIPQAHLAAGP